uniref:Uncharacterized protein n=1 Tax=viral metagenome TaxID=1070528 RepID=A0A6C0E257_9ZZZZ
MNSHKQSRTNELDKEHDSVPINKPTYHKNRRTFPLSREFTDDSDNEDLSKLYKTQYKDKHTNHNHNHNHNHKHTRKQSYPFSLNDEYDKQQYMYIKEYSHKDKQYKKEIIIKNYKKAQPVHDAHTTGEQEQGKQQEEEGEKEKEEEKEEEYLIVIKIPTIANLMSCFTKNVLKLLCYFGIISCSVL